MISSSKQWKLLVLEGVRELSYYVEKLCIHKSSTSSSTKEAIMCSSMSMPSSNDSISKSSHLPYQELMSLSTSSSTNNVSLLCIPEISLNTSSVKQSLWSSISHLAHALWLPRKTGSYLEVIISAMQSNKILRSSLEHSSEFLSEVFIRFSNRSKTAGSMML
uniref:Uncharacterized protein n=1 Tax=Opuntia streptacantha TaxID=393608 RepID=A0A7C9EK19_OPUST